MSVLWWRCPGLGGLGCVVVAGARMVAASVGIGIIMIGRVFVTVGIGEVVVTIANIGKLAE